MKKFIHKRLNEELTKSDVKKQIDDTISSKLLTDKIEKIISDKLKKNPELEEYVIDITKNVLTQLYKTLWTKRSFWQSNLKNKNS